MSILLQIDTNPPVVGRTVEVLVRGRRLQTVVRLNGLELGLRDFCAFVKFVLSNTDLTQRDGDDEDPRIGLLEELGTYRQLPGFNSGRKRLAPGPHTPASAEFLECLGYRLEPPDGEKVRGYARHGIDADDGDPGWSLRFIDAGARGWQTEVCTTGDIWPNGFGITRVLRSEGDVYSFLETLGAPCTPAAGEGGAP